MVRKQTEAMSYGIIGLGRFGSALAATLAEHITRRELRDILPEQDEDLDAVPRYHIVKDIGVI